MLAVFFIARTASHVQAGEITWGTVLISLLLLLSGFSLFAFLLYMLIIRPVIRSSGSSLQESTEENINDSEELKNMLVLREKLVFSEEAAARISHKFNNVLFTVSNSFQLAKRYLPTDNTRVNDAVQVFDREIKRAKDLSLNMYTFLIKDIEESTQSDIATIMNAAINTVKQEKETKNIEFDFKQQDSSFPLLCKPGSLGQVFMNIIINAVEAMAGNGKIIIDISENGRDYRTDFIDSGPGVPHDIKEEIFLPFSSTKSGKNAGLGLHISHTIITNHGGTISLDDKAQPGAHFSIKIPKQEKGGRSNDKEQVNTISR
jgi:signal transduction histidine kinase